MKRFLSGFICCWQLFRRMCGTRLVWRTSRALQRKRRDKTSAESSAVEKGHRLLLPWNRRPCLHSRPPRLATEKDQKQSSRWPRRPTSGWTCWFKGTCISEGAETAVYVSGVTSHQRSRTHRNKLTQDTNAAQMSTKWCKWATVTAEIPNLIHSSRQEVALDQPAVHLVKFGASVQKDDGFFLFIYQNSIVSNSLLHIFFKNNCVF